MFKAQTFDKIYLTGFCAPSFLWQRAQVDGLDALDAIQQNMKLPPQQQL